MSLNAVVGFGANVEPRLAMLRAALAELRHVAQVERTSRVLSSAPVGGPPQPDFLNAAARITYSGGAFTLLDDLLGIERRLGRERRERWGPRLIDLDLLWAGDLVLATPRLVLPHPELRRRAFALVPLLELVPGARDPTARAPYVVAQDVFAQGALEMTGEWL